MLIRRCGAVALLGAVACVSSLARAVTYDHIVVVVEENTSFSSVIGSANAPYINALATGGVNFTNFYSITHPSQPNYLQLFSGSDQGIKNDTSAGSVFTTPNLAAALAAGGKSFTGYSETMPSIGYTSDTYTLTVGQNQYVRKHNPWVNWQAASPTGTQLPASVNQPFTSFPTNYAALSSVSFVIPNEQNDMHDGSIPQADTWLSTNLAGYANWAVTHNSLLVVTFDEDDSANNNHIPTIFYGANLKNGATITTTYTSHDLLASLAGINGVSAPGLGAKAKPLYGAFIGQATPARKTFQQGVASYGGTLTNNIRADAPNTASPGAASLTVDGDTSTGTPAQVLIKFNSIFGASSVPAGAQILSAKLLLTTDTGQTSPFSADTFSLHRMIQTWDGASTWNSLIGGVSANDIEAASSYDFQILPYATANALAIFDVTDTVQLWANGLVNNGWVLTDTTGTDGWRLFGETGTVTPILEITFVPEPTSLALLAAPALFLLRRRRAKS